MTKCHTSILELSVMKESKPYTHNWFMIDFLSSVAHSLFDFITVSGDLIQSIHGKSAALNDSHTQAVH